MAQGLLTVCLLVVEGAEPYDIERCGVAPMVVPLRPGIATHQTQAALNRSIPHGGEDQPMRPVCIASAL